MKFKTVLILMAVACFVIALPILAQDADVPPIVKELISAELVAAALVVVAATKLIRNVLGGVKGWPAVAITGVVSLGYSFIEYGKNGLVYVLIVGVIAFVISAGIFKGTKLVGSKTKKIAG